MYGQHFKIHLCYLHPISFIISIHLLLLIINVPAYHAKGDYGKYYSECSKNTSFRCGNTTLYPTYPFWGEHIRPSYCGLNGFNLSCEKNEFAVIDIGSDSKYRVLKIDPIDSAIILQGYDKYLKDDTCTPKFNTTILNRKLFEYSQQYGVVEELYMFYGCPVELNVPVTFGSRNNFTCKSGDENKQVIFGVISNLEDSLDKLGEKCPTPVTVPVKWTDLERFSKNSTMLLEEILYQKFEIYYEINGSSCQECRKSGGECWNNTDSGVDPPCLYKPDKPEDLRLKIGKGGVAVISMLILLLLIFICYRRMKTRHQSSFYPKDVEAFIRKYGSSKPSRYSYATLKKLTNSFKDELGKGGYGNVYKGSLSDGRVVAVKVLNAAKGNGEDFMNEVASIGRTSHVNVVTLLGYAYEGKKRALIYEFMPNGSLEKFIHGTTPSLKGQCLSWEKLYNIALGIARGLEYLHCGCTTQILHFDIKPHNILLDEDFCPKISDFGLAKLYTRKGGVLSSIMQARGTVGYIAPEVISRNFGQVSHKSDVYSYGMMILEMVGGRKNVDTRVAHTSEIYFPRWVYKHIHDNEETNSVDNITEEENQIVRKMMIVGLWCIQTNPSQRPSISKVIEMFEGNSADLEIPPKPYMCSPPTSLPNSQKKTLSRSSSLSESDSSPKLVPRSNE